jgi:hypothetical protein
LQMPNKDIKFTYYINSRYNWVWCLKIIIVLVMNKLIQNKIFTNYIWLISIILILIFIFCENFIYLIILNKDLK